MRRRGGGGFKRKYMRITEAVFGCVLKVYIGISNEGAQGTSSTQDLIALSCWFLIRIIFVFYVYLSLCYLYVLYLSVNINVISMYVFI